MDEKRYIETTKSKSGYRCIGVGGGGMTNTMAGRWVIDRNGWLKKSIFIRKSGDLSCRLDQAIVPLDVGDIICNATGELPVDIENPGSIFTAEEIVSIKDSAGNEGKEVEVVRVEFKRGFLIPSVVEGLTTYHNRDGYLFCGNRRPDVE